jgi:hypothetical protein
MSHILFVPNAVIAMVNLLGFPWFPDSFVGCLFMKRKYFFPKSTIAGLTTKVSMLSLKVRWACLKQFTTIIAYSKKVGTISFTYLTASFLTYTMAFLKTLDAFWHKFIIAQFIYENPELLKEG